MTNIVQVMKVTLLTFYFVSSFVSPSLPFISFWSAITPRRLTHRQYNVYIEKNNLQVELIRYRSGKKNVDFNHVYFCDVRDSSQYCPPNANQEVSDTNHFGSVSDSLGRLAAVSECMASVTAFCSYSHSTCIKKKIVGIFAMTFPDLF